MLNKLKNFFKFIKIQSKKEIIFYSEGSHDTIYYKKIIQILDKKYKNKILILTSEKKDIAFELVSNFIDTLYIGDGFFRTIAFMIVKVKIFVMSVPDLDNFYLKKNKFTKTRYIYIFHSTSSSNAAYNKKAFDNYDYIFCRGPHHKSEIQENEIINSLSKKKLIKHGCPVFDEIATKKLVLQKKNLKKILIAPSWNRENELIEKEFLISLISKLLELNFNVTLRLHPMTLRRKLKRVNAILLKFSDSKKFNFSYKMENKNIIKEHDILVTDWSGIAWEFTLMLGKITFFIDTNKKIMNSAYYRFKNKAIEIELRNKIGYLIKNYNLNKLIHKISSKNLLSEFYNQKWKNINFYRKKLYYNKWNSSNIAAKEINKILING